MKLGLGLNKRNTGLGGQYVYLLELYPSDGVAYSFRELNPSYSGACFRLRRGSDNAETDIGFVDHYVDIAAIESFVGPLNVGYLATWYDQSGNGRDATQTNASGQYFMTNGNGVPNLYSGYLGGAKSANQTMDIPSFNHVDTYYTLFGAFNTIYVLGDYAPHGTSNYGLVLVDGSASAPASSGIGTPVFRANGTIIPDQNTGFDAIYNQMGCISQVGANITATEKQLTYQGLSGYGYQGAVIEHIEYATTQVNRALIEANQMSYYGI